MLVSDMFSFPLSAKFNVFEIITSSTSISLNHNQLALMDVHTLLGWLPFEANATNRVPCVVGRCRYYLHRADGCCISTFNLLPSSGSILKEHCYNLQIGDTLHFVLNL